MFLALDSLSFPVKPLFVKQPTQQGRAVGLLRSMACMKSILE